MTALRTMGGIVLASVLILALSGCPSSTPAVLSVSPTSLSWAADDNTTRTLTIVNGGASDSEALVWTATCSVAWATLSQASGTEAKASVIVTLNRAVLPEGTNSGTITVSAPDAAVPTTVTVTLSAVQSEAGEPPVASFSATNRVGNAPLEVVFSNTSTPASGVTYSWNFGDGETSTEKEPTHVYEMPGEYQVSLTVTNAEGSDTETSAADYIQVSDQTWMTTLTAPIGMRRVISEVLQRRDGSFVAVGSDFDPGIETSGYAVTLQADGTPPSKSTSPGQWEQPFPTWPFNVLDVTLYGATQLASGNIVVVGAYWPLGYYTAEGPWIGPQLLVMELENSNGSIVWTRPDLRQTDPLLRAPWDLLPTTFAYSLGYGVVESSQEPGVLFVTGTGGPNIMIAKIDTTLPVTEDWCVDAKAYGGTYTGSLGRDIMERSDHTFQVCGTAIDDPADTIQAYVVRVNSGLVSQPGTEVYGDEGMSWSHSLCQTEDNTVIYSGVNLFTHRVFGVRFGDVANEFFEDIADFNWDESEFGGGGAVCATTDGNAVIAGTQVRFDNVGHPESFDIVITKVTSGLEQVTDGNWPVVTVDRPKYMLVNTIAPTMTGGFVLSGASYEADDPFLPTASVDAVVMRFDVDGYNADL